MKNWINLAYTLFVVLFIIWIIFGIWLLMNGVAIGMYVALGGIIATLITVWEWRRDIK